MAVQLILGHFGARDVQIAQYAQHSFRRQIKSASTRIGSVGSSVVHIANMPPSRSKNGNGVGEGAEEIGADARKYNGLFSEKDWKCKLCGNINWARRHVCNQCQTPKPGTGQDAQREGYGGGFMDREPKVEYRSTRYASDDDYDDFGRRKKKRKGVECTQSVSPADEAGARERKGPEGSATTEVQDDDDGDDDGKWDAWADILGDNNMNNSSQGIEESKSVSAGERRGDSIPERDLGHDRLRRRDLGHPDRRSRSPHRFRDTYQGTRRELSPSYRDRHHESAQRQGALRPGPVRKALPYEQRPRGRSRSRDRLRRY